jgi:hypothetical protein
MKSSVLPFAIPAKLPADLARVRDYWESLKRGENNMPFWDDVKLSSLPDLSDRLMLVDAFEKPKRFRLNAVGEKIRKRCCDDLPGKFVDEIAPKAPFDFLTAQASATIEAKAPTFFVGQASTESGEHRVTPVCCFRCGATAISGCCLGRSKIWRDASTVPPDAISVNRFLKVRPLFSCWRYILKVLFTVFATTLGCLILAATLANAQNHYSAAEQSFAQAPRTPEAPRCKMLRTYGACKECAENRGFGPEQYNRPDQCGLKPGRFR